MPYSSLCEVFGYPVGDFSETTIRSQKEKLCPFNNKVPQCTKVSVKDPLGVCSIWEGGREKPIIVCPIRFRKSWKIIQDTAGFLLKSASKDFVTEVTLKDANGDEIGNIDVVLIDHDEDKIYDFGALEIQAVYIYLGQYQKSFRVLPRGSPKPLQPALDRGELATG